MCGAGWFCWLCFAIGFWPEPEGVFQVGEFFAQLVQVKVLFGVAVGDQPGLFYLITFNIALRALIRV